MAKRKTTPKAEAPAPNPPPSAIPPLRLEYRTAGELAENPKNWRLHPEAQTKALADVIAEVGYAGALLFNERTGRLVDGHARRKIAKPEEQLPVLIGSWTEEQEAKILATLDPLAAMAEADKPKLDALLREVGAQSEPVAQMLTDLAKEHGIAAPDSPAAEDLSDMLAAKFAVYLECKSEHDQGAIIKELHRHGLEPRALSMPAIRREPQEPPAVVPQIPATARRIKVHSQIKRTARTIQVEGIFDLPPTKKSEKEWLVDLDLNWPWQIGLILGPSGSGKSTIARELFGDKVIAGWDWPKDQLRRLPSLNPVHGGDLKDRAGARSFDRLTVGFEYVGPQRADDAKRLGVV